MDHTKTQHSTQHGLSIFIATIILQFYRRRCCYCLSDWICAHWVGQATMFPFCKCPNIFYMICLQKDFQLSGSLESTNSRRKLTQLRSSVQWRKNCNTETGSYPMLWPLKPNRTKFNYNVLFLRTKDTNQQQQKRNTLSSKLNRLMISTGNWVLQTWVSKIRKWIFLWPVSVCIRYAFWFNKILYYFPNKAPEDH